LGVLRNQEYQREIVHPQGDVKQRIRIDQKDYIFDSFLNRSWYTLCSEVHGKFQHQLMNVLITSELQKNAESSLEVQRTLYNICSQDRVDVLFYVLPFESFPHGITELRYYLGRLRTLPANEP
jgi:hypothetical protein